MTKPTAISLGLKANKGKVFLVHYGYTEEVAAVITSEREAYLLADTLNSFVTHVPVFTSVERALTDSNIAYEAERIANDLVSEPKHGQGDS